MIDRLPWRVFLALIILLPLPFGSFMPWLWSLAGALISISLLIWAGLSASGRVTPVWRPALWPPVLLFLLVVIWALIQVIPLGAGAAHPIWPLAAEALGEPLRGSISIAPQASLVSLIRLLTAGGVFWIALQYGRDRDRAFELLRWIGCASGAYALYGLVNYVAGNDLLLWYERSAYHGDVTGTFVNRNTYATFAGIGLLTAVAMLVHMFRRRWRLSDPSLSRMGRWFEALRGEAALYMTIAIIVAMAWLQSHSRMGFAATLVGLATLLLVGRTITTLRGRVIGFAAAVMAVGLLLRWSGGRLLYRIGVTDTIDRFPIFTLTSRAIESAPLTGQGYGSFSSIFPMYRDMTLPGDKTYSFAHNSYLELGAEIGLPATIMLVACILWLALLCLIGAYRRNRDNMFPSLAFAATVLIGVHACLDFSVQIPAISCLFAALLGVGNAQAWASGPSTAAIGSGRIRSFHDARHVEALKL